MSLGDITGKEAGVESLASQEPVDTMTSLSPFQVPIELLVIINPLKSE